jgi:hypothetical protein
MRLATVTGFMDELEKIGWSFGNLLRGGAHAAESAAHTPALTGVKGALSRFSHMEAPVEVAGLGALAVPSIDNMVAKMRARRSGMVDASGHPTEEGIESKRLIKEKWHDPIEAGGLGLLAAPYLAGRVAHGKWGH